jgi:hypothetical protein
MLACITDKFLDQPATLRVAMRAGNLRAMQARRLTNYTVAAEVTVTRGTSGFRLDSLKS